MKQILIALGLIIVAAQTEGAQINENWEIGNSVFTLKSETLHSSFKDITLSPYEKAIRG